MKTSLESGNLNPTLRETVARVIGTIIFYSLLALIALVAIPYGTAETWWKALFQCVVFILTGMSVTQRLLSRDVTRHDRRLLLPILVLIVFALLQTFSWRPYSIAGVDNLTSAISADPFQTRLFVSQLSALLLAGLLLVIYTTTRKRLRLLVEVIIAIGVISAGFGILRQASQHQVGFGLPFLLPAYGYGQFINANHFAFLMEMALGLALGIAVCRGVRGRRLALYLIAAIPMWVALIRANSRAGALSILCQVVFLAFLLGSQRISMRDQANADYSLSSRAGRPLAIRAVLVIALLVAATLTIIFVGGGPLISKLDSISIELGKNSTDSPEARTPEARAPNIDSRVLEQSRLNTWRATWRLIKDHPIAGVGFGSYWIGITPYHQSSGWTTPQEAHNDYLELLASGGLVGVAIGVWFAIAFFRIALRKVRDADSYNRAVTLGALAGILPVAVHSLVDYGLHITINALVLTALISIVVINIREDETSFQGVDS